MLLQKVPAASRFRKSGRGSFDYRGTLSLDRIGSRENISRPLSDDLP